MISTENFRFYHSLEVFPNPDDYQTHIHTDHCEICYFVSGKGIFHIEGSDYHLKKGDVLIMDTTESHHIEISPGEPYERYVLHFKKDFIEQIDKDRKLLEAIENRSPGKQNLLRKHYFKNDFFFQIIHNMINSPQQDELLVATNLFAILNEIRNIFNSPDFNTIDNDDTLINQIIYYIMDNLDEHISLDDICKKFYLSKSQLCRVFKKSTGTTVWNYITSKRLIKVKELVEMGVMPTKIFSQYGFSDYSAFYRAYKKYFNHSPTKQ